MCLLSRSKQVRGNMHALNLDMTPITSCANVISIEHVASAVFLLFLTSFQLPFRERKSVLRFVKNI